MSSGGSEACAAGRFQRVLALVPHHGAEPPADLSAAAAEAIWAAASAAWHPAVLAGLAGLPRVERIEAPPAPEPGDLWILAAGAEERLPSGYRVQAADAGVPIIDGFGTRDALIARLLETVPGQQAEDATPRGEPDCSADYLALGTLRWWLGELTVAMGHADCLDLESLTREVLAGARAACAGESTGAESRLRAAFEILTRARERFYPVDCYLLDACLLDPATSAVALDGLLEPRTPITLLATAQAMASARERAPGFATLLVAGVDEGWLDVVGGTYAETDEPLRPWSSVLWQFHRAAEVYRSVIDDRTTETLARRRFALYGQLPQIARRFGFRYGVYWALDGGQYPAVPEAKRMWEAVEGSSLEALARPPVAADRAIEGVRLPWIIGRTMRGDTVATVPLVHWPESTAGWYRDFRRSARFAPVLMRWVTHGDYFHLTDRPFETIRPERDRLRSPYLDQAVARGALDPISGRVTHLQERLRLDALGTAQSILAALGQGDPAPGDPSPAAIQLAAAEEALETRADASLTETLAAEVSAGFERLLGATARESRPGYLVINPVAVARRAVVKLPEAAIDLGPEGPLRVAQFTAEGVIGVVDLPALGYAWVPRASHAPYDPTAGRLVGSEGRRLWNEFAEVLIDESTGGLRSIKAPGEARPRLGQQLVVVRPDGASATRTVSTMQAGRFEVEYGGPALVQARSEGTLAEAGTGRRLAGFVQAVRLWAGRPLVELEVVITDLEPGVIAAAGPAWQDDLALRWAWPDPESTLRRAELLNLAQTEADRPETSEAFEIVGTRGRTALLFGGLAHHRRQGPRMLDTLLITGAEQARTFRVAIALDHDQPHQAIVDAAVAPLVVATEQGPPGPGPTGWFVHLDRRNVALIGASHAATSETGERLLAFTLVETAGQSARCRLRLPGHLVAARQTDFQGELLYELTIEGDAVRLDLTPHELARVEVVVR